MQKLSEIQNKEEEYCMPKDKNGQRTTLTKQRSFPRYSVIEHFQINYPPEVDNDEREQIVTYLKNPILQQAVYGVLLYNSNKQVN